MVAFVEHPISRHCASTGNRRQHCSSAANHINCRAVRVPGVMGVQQRVCETVRVPGVASWVQQRARRTTPNNLAAVHAAAALTPGIGVARGWKSGTRYLLFQSTRYLWMIQSARDVQKLEISKTKSSVADPS